MNKQHEKLLVATLAGLVIVATAAFAVSPALAAGYTVDAQAQVTGVEDWDTLNMRKWPASYSQKVGELEADTHVWVIRCRTFETTSDWCLVERGDDYGWVNASYLEIDDPEGDDGDDFDETDI
jgi:invasion protein IalB